MTRSQTPSNAQETTVSIGYRIPFASDVTRLISGTTFAQLLSILAAPILARFYAPEVFGTLALFTSITSILSVISCLRYELAIMLPKSDKEAASLLGISSIFALVISLLTVPIIWWGKEPLLYWLKAPQLEAYLWLVPLAIFINGIFSALTYWNTRIKHFTRLSISQISSSAVTTFVQISFGITGFTTNGAMISSGIAGKILAVIVLNIQIWQNISRYFLHPPTLNEVTTLLKRYHKFPLYDTWSALLNNMSWQLPIIMLSSLFSSTEVGYYALGFRVLQMPMNLIGGAISQVFFQRAAEAKKQGLLDNLVEKTFQQLVMLGMFPMLLLAVIGKNLYTVVFGPEWGEAGIYAQILAIWTFFWFISSPISTLISILERQEFGLKFNICLLLTRFASIAIGGYMGNARISLVFFAITGTLLYGYLSFALMTMAKVHPINIARTLYHSFLRFIPFGIATMFLLFIQISNMLLLFLSFIFLAAYIFFLWRQQPNLFLEASQ